MVDFVGALQSDAKSTATKYVKNAPSEYLKSVQSGESTSDFVEGYAKNLAEDLTKQFAKDAVINTALATVGVPPGTFTIAKKVWNLMGDQGGNPQDPVGQVVKSGKDIAIKAIVGERNIPGLADAVVGDKTVRVQNTLTFLPMPQDIQVSYPKNWAGAETILGSQEFLNSEINVDTAYDTAATAIGKLAGREKAKFMYNKIGEKFGQRAVDSMHYAKGKTLNDNIKLLFENIPFREFQFTYQFSPNTPAEMEQLKAWIKDYKERSAPRLMKGEAYILYPETFQIEGLNTNLFNTGKCALTNVSVNYTPQGIWSQHKDKNPTTISVTLSYTEIELAFRHRIEQDNW